MVLVYHGELLKIGVDSGGFLVTVWIKAHDSVQTPAPWQATLAAPRFAQACDVRFGKVQLSSSRRSFFCPRDFDWLIPSWPFQALSINPACWIMCQQGKPQNPYQPTNPPIRIWKLINGGWKLHLEKTFRGARAPWGYKMNDTIPSYNHFSEGISSILLWAYTPKCISHWTIVLIPFTTVNEQ